MIPSATASAFDARWWRQPINRYGWEYLLYATGLFAALAAAIGSVRMSPGGYRIGFMSEILPCCIYVAMLLRVVRALRASGWTNRFIVLAVFIPAHALIYEIILGFARVWYHTGIWRGSWFGFW